MQWIIESYEYNKKQMKASLSHFISREWKVNSLKMVNNIRSMKHYWLITYNFQF